ncbi:c-type cytochrome [Devosia naphthalenivorans]|uniref:c-type cytochrome n=1 Tax=Devosia naphthalenivorans TaxID=2082392 RepID=UPI000D34C1F4|nr:c-type cytochrome [Devosia naphthalenivorans]
MARALQLAIGLAIVVVGAGVLAGSAGLFGQSIQAPHSKPDEVATTTSSAPVRPPAETFAAIFRPCAHCHQIGEGARAVTGPVLNDVFGRPAASGDYPYSKAMKESGLVWDAATLRDFLVSPQDVVPGSRMYFQGVPESEVDAIIEFLGDPQADAPAVKPTAAESR